MTTTKRFYRIEHRVSRKGPFAEGVIRAAKLHAYGGGRRYDTCCPFEMPGPSDPREREVHDHLDRHGGRFKPGTPVRFGWATKAQMRRWFRPALLRSLGRIGYVLAIYEANDYAITPHQVSFHGPSARLVGEEVLR